LTIEDIRDHLGDILDADNLTIATDPRNAAQTGIDEVAHLMEAKPYQAV
jgi:hypothetical protein